MLMHEKYLERDSIQKSGKKDMVSRFLVRPGGIHQIFCPKKAYDKAFDERKAMVRRKNCNLLALVLQIQIRIISIVSAIT